MSLPPIVLWAPKAALASDGACTSILQYQLASAPSSTQAPYYQSPQETNDTLSYIPPLVYFCIKSMLEYPDQIHALGPGRLIYERPTDGHDFDILQALIPTYRPFSAHHADFDLRVVDPRLWAVIVQIYEGLPAVFREYNLPLSDAYLPLLQAIPSTNNFSLVTVLSLAKCRELTDDTVLELRHLHTLSALDASVTALGTWGMQRLAKSLSWTDGDGGQCPERRGPWGLRVLYLKDCINIDDEVFDCLSHFPLLSVIDLRGTVCLPSRHQTFGFSSSSDKKLFQPGALSEVLGHLAALTKKPRTLFSHPAPYVLSVDSLTHKLNPIPSYRLPSNLWGFEGPDKRHAELQGAHHGRDVFLPYELPKPRYESPPHGGYLYEIPQISGNIDEMYVEDEDEDEVGSTPEPEPIPNTWMDEIAEEELTLYRKQRSVNRFYASSGPRRAISLSDLPGRGISVLPSESTSQGPPDPLMLFRTPPPWNSLPSCPPTKPSSAVRVPLTMAPSNASSFTSSDPPSKRRCVEDIAPADKARKSMHALSSIQSMFSMVKKRAADCQSNASSTAQLSSNANLPVRRNPFVRHPGAQSRKAPKLNMQPAGPLESVAVDKAKAACKSQPASRPRSEARTAVAVRSDAPSPGKKAPRTNNTRPSTPKGTPSRAPPVPKPLPDPSGLPHPSGKKLKPITTLTVPDWPASASHLREAEADHPCRVAGDLIAKIETEAFALRLGRKFDSAGNELDATCLCANPSHESQEHRSCGRS
ncbi:hypothetical protein L226DRAFT_557339 [Lentinus tigrinus ALCF2SS1-7]|uniref:Uncharacterized protein n=1 Tax=Lentinus tigrinus ALCF2SS1-6 TaxID=1328759 RepID=A0A5C2SRZ2_9APHY|nr:hypothetical protein L227DRAFT_597431 [Lentinus tigrinus ALCF2SS1-6]RPD80043.1 hypothetical protein L226DRAFT_557339 [Lentinus tigrinus ALCF2SS1-7]